MKSKWCTSEGESNTPQPVSCHLLLLDKSGNSVEPEKSKTEALVRCFHLNLNIIKFMGEAPAQWI